MESLTKQQIVLVTLLVSFVTSIATGIVTVALYDQAPKAVTQTINRVVERTVERVVTEPAKNTNPSVVTKETIVVREDDRVTDAVSKNTKSIVRLEFGTGTEKKFVTLGLIVTSDGVVAVQGDMTLPDTDYSATLSDGIVYKLKPIKLKDSGQYAFLRLIPPGEKQMTFIPVTLASGDQAKLGQSVVSLSGQTKDIVETGIIQSLMQKEIKSSNAQATTTESTPVVKNTYAFETDIRDSVMNSPLLNLSGEVLGLKVPQYENEYIYATTDVLKKELEVLQSNQKIANATSTATSSSQVASPLVTQ